MTAHTRRGVTEFSWTDPTNPHAFRLRVYKDRKKEWRWTVFAKNGRKRADSAEGYKRLGTCRKAAEHLFPQFAQHAPSEPDGP